MLVNRILIGGLFVIVGVVITFFHEHVIKSWDYWNNALWGIVGGLANSHAEENSF
jgi:hypothetical protein